MKKKSNAYWKKRAVDLAKQIIRRAGRCEKCGRRDDQGWQMHGAHVIPVTYAATAADLDNIICLCAACHSMGPNSAHQHPHEFVRWFDQVHPGRYERLKLKSRPVTKVDFEAVYEQLKTHQVNGG